MSEPKAPLLQTGERFGGFVMTYERPQILVDTIKKIMGQSRAPEKLLIVDNSESDATREAVMVVNDARISYYRVGYNAGPAGAARIGLETLAAEGYEWIYWGDDDDPPQSPTVFEELLAMASVAENAGAVASVGGYLNRYTGRTRTLSTAELNGTCEVDYVPGGKNLIVNSRVVHRNILPSPELFYGFEELDFCLKMRKAGFRIYVDGDRWKRNRIASGRVSDYRWSGKAFGTKQLAMRDFYSARNMLFILKRNGLYVGLCWHFLKVFLKSVAGFAYGVGYGKTAMKLYMASLAAFISGKTGKVSWKL